MLKCTVKVCKENQFDIKFRLTKGELLALQNALCSYNTPVANDVLAFLRNALTQVQVTL